MKEFKINENDAGQRLNKFIEKTFLNIPNSLIYKSIRKKNIKINNKKSFFNYILNFGDIVNVYGLDDYFKKKVFDLNINKKLDIIFEDDNILILNKGSGVKTQPDSKRKDSLIDLVIQYLIEKKKYIPEKENSFIPAFCTRLDFNTRGLIIAAKNAKSLRCLNELTRKGKIKKEYECVVEGVMKKNHDRLIGYWSKNFNKNKVIITSKKRENSKKVITEYFLLKQFKNSAKLKVLIKLGKSQQIRAHMKQIGHPIIGDFKYGSSVNKNLQLICRKIAFDSKNSVLSYLDNKEIVLKNNLIT